MLLHSVQSVTQGSCKSSSVASVLGNSRVNFTFRSAPNILWREKEFETGKFWFDA